MLSYPTRLRQYSGGRTWQTLDLFLPFLPFLVLGMTLFLLQCAQKPTSSSSFFFYFFFFLLGATLMRLPSVYLFCNFFCTCSWCSSCSNSFQKCHLGPQTFSISCRFFSLMLVEPSAILCNMADLVLIIAVRKGGKRRNGCGRREYCRYGTDKW